MSLKNRSFLKLLDYTPAEIEQLLDLAADLKAKKKAGIAHDKLHGKNIALIFEKTSTRTRCSFEVAAHDLGMEVTYLDPSGSQIGKKESIADTDLDPSGSQIGKKESIADTARVLGRMFDGIEYRGYGQQIVSLGMSDDNILNACIYKHCSGDFSSVSALLLEVHILSAYCYICTFYSLYNRYNIDCRNAVYNFNIIAYYKRF